MSWEATISYVWDSTGSHLGSRGISRDDSRGTPHEIPRDVVGYRGILRLPTTFKVGSRDVRLYPGWDAVASHETLSGISQDPTWDVVGRGGIPWDSAGYHLGSRGMSRDGSRGTPHGIPRDTVATYDIPGGIPRQPV